MPVGAARSLSCWNTGRRHRRRSLCRWCALPLEVARSPAASPRVAIRGVAAVGAPGRDVSQLYSLLRLPRHKGPGHVDQQLGILAALGNRGPRLFAIHDAVVEVDEFLLEGFFI